MRRQRQQFARKIRSLTAMGRMSAYVLGGIPFFLAFAISFLNPGYMSPLFHTHTGHILVIRAKTLEEMGDYEEAIATLRRALPLVDGEREPRLRWGLCFNLAENLFQVGRFSEAEPLLPGVQELLEDEQREPKHLK